MGCEVLSFLHYSGGHMIASYYNVHLFLSSTALNILHPITPVKGAAPLSEWITDSAISWKTKSSKKGACVHFCSPYFLAIKQINDVRGDFLYCLKYHVLHSLLF